MTIAFEVAGGVIIAACHRHGAPERHALGVGGLEDLGAERRAGVRGEPGAGRIVEEPSASSSCVRA